MHLRERRREKLGLRRVCVLFRTQVGTGLGCIGRVLGWAMLAATVRTTSSSGYLVRSCKHVQLTEKTGCENRTLYNPKSDDFVLNIVFWGRRLRIESENL